MERIMAERCKQARKRHAKTQRQIATATGYSKESISKFELGQTNNAEILIYYLTNFLTVKELIGG